MPLVLRGKTGGTQIMPCRRYIAPQALRGTAGIALRESAGSVESEAVTE